MIGPNADSRAALYGNYNGDSGEFITDVMGIRAAAKGARIFYSKGAHLYMDADPICKPGNLLGEAASAAEASDVAILSVGYDSTLEGEEGDASNYFASGDRTDLLLPPSQRALCETVLGTGKPVILVVHSGSCVDVSAYEGRAAAILQVWYGGERGGEALANILFGKTSPSGKLPVTMYRNSDSLPSIEEYSMRGRTYRYLDREPLYSFGYGLSYTQFRYSDLCVAVRNGKLRCSVMVENVGHRTGGEVVQAYLRYEGEAFEKPNFSLVSFSRVQLRPGQKRTLRFTIAGRQLEGVTREGRREKFPGRYTLFVGGHAPDARSMTLAGGVLQAEFSL